MVVNNTQQPKNTLEVKHLVEVPTCECTIATARNKNTNETKVFLITSYQNRIYERKGISHNWSELEPDGEHSVSRLVRDALHSDSVPRYSTNTLSAIG